VIYLDTAALTKLIAPEPETLSLYQWLVEGHDSWVASVLVEVELVRVVRRTDPAALATALGLLGAIDIMPLDELVVARSQQLLDPGLRSLDAIHLATALEVGEISAFVTYDQRLLKAAEAHGLPTVAPS
jgi:predicted nucleic acid-binding protein